MATAQQVTLYAQTGTASPGTVRTALEAAAATGSIPLPDRVTGAESAGLPAGWTMIYFPGVANPNALIAPVKVALGGVAVQKAVPAGAAAGAGPSASIPDMTPLPTTAAPPDTTQTGGPPSSLPPQPWAATGVAGWWASTKWYEKVGVVAGGLGLLVGLVGVALGGKGKAVVAGGAAARRPAPAAWTASMIDYSPSDGADCGCQG